MKTILLKLAGPLQSWGSNSHFETRHTDFYPSKSAIIGMIAASLGYRRDEDEKIQKLNNIEFAVRVDQQGTLLRDYHTVHKYKSNGAIDRTYVTNRYYLNDAVFVVAFSHHDDAFMSKIERSLRMPYFQPYMGRRSLPLCIDFIIDVTNDSVIDSLKKCDWQASEWYARKYGDKVTHLEVYADSVLLENNNHNLRKDRVISFSHKERKFGYRYETKINVSVPNKATGNSTEHDIWDSIGE